LVCGRTPQEELSARPHIYALSAEEQLIIRLAIICLVIAALAALLGFGGVAGAFVGIAKFLFFLAIALFVIFLVLGVMAGRRIVKGRD